MNTPNYYEEFMQSFDTLCKTRSSILEAETLADISRLEREAQQNLFAIQHYSMRLAYWVKEAVNDRRKELASPQEVKDSLHTETISPVVEKEKPKRRTAKSKAKSTKAK